MTETKVKKIFIVDDELPMLHLIDKYLHTLSYETRPFSSAIEAVAACENEQPDLLITDILMPKMNGVELIEAIHTVHPHLPVICCSGHATPQTLEHLKTQNIKAFLQKPFKLEELAALVKNALSTPTTTNRSKKRRGTSILVVDDNKPLLESIEIFLSQKGFKVNTCIDGQEALECYTVCNPDIIISDLIMPNVSGIELIQQIKASAPEQIIIPISGEADRSTIEACEELVGHKVLRKPVDFVHLLEIINHIGKKRLNRSSAAKSESILKKATDQMPHASQEKFQRQWKNRLNQRRGKPTTWQVALLIFMVSIISGIVISYAMKPTIEPIEQKKGNNQEIMKMGSDMLKYLHRDENRELERDRR